jgi:inosine-uridine nucleoside N-ribohydrolase
MPMRMFIMNCDSGIDDALALMLAPSAATAYQ